MMIHCSDRISGAVKQQTHAHKDLHASKYLEGPLSFLLNTEYLFQRSSTLSFTRRSNTTYNKNPDNNMANFYDTRGEMDKCNFE